jgi:hypothetical protein
LLLNRASRNRERRNEETRERMARLRAQDATVAPEVLEARLAARREAACKYREKCVLVNPTSASPPHTTRNRRTLKFKAREMRHKARGLKEHQKMQ